MAPPTEIAGSIPPRLGHAFEIQCFNLFKEPFTVHRTSSMFLKACSNMLGFGEDAALCVS